MNANPEHEPGREWPLLELFYRLRDADLPLGIAEYELLLRALMAGFGFDGEESLKQLCQMLWIKTPDEEVVFNHIFDQFLSEYRPRKKPVVGAGRLDETIETEDRTRPPGDKMPPVDDGRDTEGQGPPKETTDGEEEPELDRPDDDKETEQPVEDDKTRPPKRPDKRPARPKRRRITPELTSPDAGAFDEATEYLVAGSGQATRGVRDRRYRFKVDYLPITKRQMKQSWRYLRKAVREGPPVEFDVEATVDKVAIEGRLYEPVMRPRRINRAAMLLLVDQEGSMTPFHGFSRRLEETAVRGGRLGQTNVYYFNNYPLDVLYCNPFFSESRQLDEVMRGLHPTRTAVLIFSDAGAAHGRFDYGRVDLTRAFLQRVYQSVRNVAWINPMPPDRWANSSAAAIARSVPMFDVSRQGLQNAISVLRGRTIPRR